ncbi:snf2/rad54 family member [Anaeramoeba flamelloides]|uniref:Snf2/rad54 family member n=1 Tax=Anaeramoeba flamelloides TaxID=1746091 RepID=A0AAV7YRR2_9EUKA|nr:snf2/rad54 family member [Anaeramoeba flamelloides]
MSKTSSKLNLFDYKRRKQKNNQQSHFNKNNFNNTNAQPNNSNAIGETKEQNEKEKVFSVDENKSTIPKKKNKGQNKKEIENERSGEVENETKINKNRDKNKGKKPKEKHSTYQTNNELSILGFNTIQASEIESKVIKEAEEEILEQEIENRKRAIEKVTDKFMETQEKLKIIRNKLKKNRFNVLDQIEQKKIVKQLNNIKKSKSKLIFENQKTQQKLKDLKRKNRTQPIFGFEIENEIGISKNGWINSGRISEKSKKERLIRAGKETPFDPIKVTQEKRNPNFIHNLINLTKQRINNYDDDDDDDNSESESDDEEDDVEEYRDYEDDDFNIESNDYTNSKYLRKKKKKEKEKEKEKRKGKEREKEKGTGLEGEEDDDGDGDGDEDEDYSDFSSSGGNNARYNLTNSSNDSYSSESLESLFFEENSNTDESENEIGSENEGNSRKRKFSVLKKIKSQRIRKRKRKGRKEREMEMERERIKEKIRESNQICDDDGDLKVYKKRVKTFIGKEFRSNNESEDIHFEGGYKIPSFLWNKLFNYQKTAVKWLWELHQKGIGGVMADEMGLGKTIQIVAFLAGLHYSQKFRPTLIVCYATIMKNFIKEIHTFWPLFRVALLHSSTSFQLTKEEIIKLIAEDGDILITTYETLKYHSKLFLKVNWDYIVLDEGMKIKNPEASVSKICKKLHSKHRIILSGTPIQNNLMELWSIFDFVYPTKLGTQQVFLEQFAIPIRIGSFINASKIEIQAAYKCVLLLRELISPFMLRRLKKDVQPDLPKKNELVLFCQLTDFQTEKYKQYLNSRLVREILSNYKKIGKGHIFSSIEHLRKICNHPDLCLFSAVELNKSNRIYKKKMRMQKNGNNNNNNNNNNRDDDNNIINSGNINNKKKKKYKMIRQNETYKTCDELINSGDYGSEERSGKLKVLSQILPFWKKNGHRALIFSQRTTVLDIIESFIQKKNYKYLRIDGTTAIRKRNELIETYQNDHSYFIFLLTTKVGGLGINLVSADRLIIYDPDWNPGNDNQAIDRIFRIGQTKNVTILRLITAGSIEEKIYQRGILKNQLSQKILNNPFKKNFFTRKKMRDLFTFKPSNTKTTETELIFSEVNPTLKFKDQKRKLNNQKSNLEKQQLYTVETFNNNDDDDKNSNSKNNGQSDKNNNGILQYLFDSNTSTLNSIINHDKIVDNTNDEQLLIEKEADKIVENALNALKQSRELVNQNNLDKYYQKKREKIRNRLLIKKQNTLIENQSTLLSQMKMQDDDDDDDDDDGNDNDDDDDDEDYEDNNQSNSFSILNRMKQRTNTSKKNSRTNNKIDPKKLSQQEKKTLTLLSHLKKFLQSKGYKSPTNNIITYFNRMVVSSQDKILFKNALNKIAHFRKRDKIWILKREFRK